MIETQDGSTKSTPRHSADFTSVNWYGQTYQFNKTQAQCIELLWREWEKGGLGLSEKTIGEAINSADNNYRLRNTFRSRRRNDKGYEMDPAWEEMIVSAGKGIFCLNPLKSQ